MSETFFAPAKLNLFLHVTGRRADGYHLLESVFQLVDFGDTITIGLRAGGAVRRLNEVAGVPEEADLAIRAARLLQRASGTRQGADITIEKRLPQGGGLGGGSSDAATVLLALNRLWGVNFTRQQLMALGLSLGADVPFFVFGENAFAEGVGERLQGVELPPLWYVVLTPQVSVPTAAIFQSPELTRNAKSGKIADFSAGGSGWLNGQLKSGQPGGFPEPRFRNDLQPVAESKYPEIGRAIAWLQAADKAAVISARMTGSGACVFAGFGGAGGEAAAQAVFAQRPAGLGGFVACGLPRHPMHDFAT